jgi:hypothetical protein
MCIRKTHFRPLREIPRPTWNTNVCSLVLPHTSPSAYSSALLPVRSMRFLMCFLILLLNQLANSLNTSVCTRVAHMLLRDKLASGSFPGILMMSGTRKEKERVLIWK